MMSPAWALNHGLALALRYLILPYQAYYQMLENCTIPSPRPTSNQAEYRVILDCSGDVGRTYRCHPVAVGMPPNRPSDPLPTYRTVHVRRRPAETSVCRSHCGEYLTHVPRTDDDQSPRYASLQWLIVSGTWSFTIHTKHRPTQDLLCYMDFQSPLHGGHRALCT